MAIDYKCITIYGDFWDSLIFDDSLYLWTMNGEIWVIDFPAFYCEHSDGRYLELNNLENYLKYKLTTPYKNRHTDIDIFNDVFYFTTDAGIFRININDLSQGRINKIWDATILSLKIKNTGRIALSAGNDGLYEYDLNTVISTENSKCFARTDRDDLYKITGAESYICEWMFSSIYSTSRKNKSLIAGFNWDKFDLRYKRIISFDEIFRDNLNTFNWGIGNKIYRIVDDGLEYLEFTQSRIDNNNISPFSTPKKIPFQPWKGKLLSAGDSKFGIIIECENALVVMKDDENYLNIPGPIARWRTYVETPKYQNHLHVIDDNSISLYIFDLPKKNIYNNPIHYYTLRRRS